MHILERNGIEAAMEDGFVEGFEVKSGIQAELTFKSSYQHLASEDIYFITNPAQTGVRCVLYKSTPNIGGKKTTYIRIEAVGPTEKEPKELAKMVSKMLGLKEFENACKGFFPVSNNPETEKRINELKRQLCESIKAKKEQIYRKLDCLIEAYIEGHKL